MEFLLINLLYLLGGLFVGSIKLWMTHFSQNVQVKSIELIFSVWRIVAVFDWEMRGLAVGSSIQSKCVWTLSPANLNDNCCIKLRGWWAPMRRIVREVSICQPTKIAIVWDHSLMVFLRGSLPIFSLYINEICDCDQPWDEGNKNRLWNFTDLWSDLLGKFRFGDIFQVDKMFL